MPRWGLLLVNLGTPDAPTTRAVRRYLRQFLSDPRVIDLPWPLRALLLYGSILPFRSGRSARAYQKVWTDEGSPLLVFGRDLARGVAQRLGGDVPVELGMRYGSPSIESALSRLRAEPLERIVVLPLFPQYSSAAWESAVEEVFRVAGRGVDVPALSVVPPYYEHPAFVDPVCEVARPVLQEAAPDRILMSFHGLPERHITAGDASGGRHCLQDRSCCDRVVAANRHCYRAHCFATARAVARGLELAGGSWEVTFQSRLGRTPWIKPYTDVRVRELAKEGVRRLAVLCPSFVADCLETLEEIGIRAREDFQAHGGEELTLVPCVNARQPWVDGVVRLVGGNVGQHRAGTRDDSL